MFDSLEARLNRVVMAKLANATAVIGGVGTPVIFDAEYVAGSVGVGMGAASPQMVMSSAAVPVDFVGQEISVRDVTWRVADCQPDSGLPTGLALVMLEKP